MSAAASSVSALVIFKNDCINTYLIYTHQETKKIRSLIKRKEFYLIERKTYFADRMHSVKGLVTWHGDFLEQGNRELFQCLHFTNLFQSKKEESLRFDSQCWHLVSYSNRVPNLLRQSEALCWRVGDLTWWFSWTRELFQYLFKCLHFWKLH